MSSFDGLSQLADHHRFYNFNAMHRRSDSVESHGSVSSLSSNHSSAGGGNGGSLNATPTTETSRFRRAEPPRTLNTGSPAKNSTLGYHQVPREPKLKSYQPQKALLHSTSVMETPGRQQTLNRSRSGSCPIVWEANGSLREHTSEVPKHRHPQSSFTGSPFSPRHSERPLYGQMTGSVQYVGSQHDDCRALGGARMLHNSGVLTPPSWHPGYERPQGIQRCPTEESLADSIQSPSPVVSSLQRSLSTMSMSVAPSNSFTSKLNCSLSRSYVSKLNDISKRREESKKDVRNGRPNFLQTQLPSFEMGLNYNVPHAGLVKQHREAFERNTGKKEPTFSPRNAPLSNRGQYKHRSFENINSMSNQHNQASTLTPIENKSNSHLPGLTPVENRFNGRQKALTPGEGKREGQSHPLANFENKRDNWPLARASVESKRDSLGSARDSARRQRDLHLSALNARENQVDVSPDTDTPSPEKVWNWSPLKAYNGSAKNKRIGGSLTSLRSISATAVSDNEFEPRSAERVLENTLTPKSEEKSMYVSEMFVNIAKPRPLSGLPKDRNVCLHLSGKRPLTSSVSSNDLPSHLNPNAISASRSSLPSAVQAVDRAPPCERTPWDAATAATANRRHSSPTDKITDVPPDVKAHVARQKECLKSLLNDVSSLHQYRDQLRISNAQKEKEAQERRRQVTTNHLPSAFELEKLLESNRQLKLDVKKLSREVELTRSRRNFLETNEGAAWSCMACTFINHPALDNCECCELPKLSFVMR